MQDRYCLLLVYRRGVKHWSMLITRMTLSYAGAQLQDLIVRGRRLPHCSALTLILFQRGHYIMRRFFIATIATWPSVATAQRLHYVAAKSAATGRHRVAARAHASLFATFTMTTTTA